MSISPKIAVILAGGQARRFGGKDKGEILIGDERLVDIIFCRIKSQSDEIIISGRHDYGLGLDVIPDAPDGPGGPVGGIYSLWKFLAEKSVEGFFTAAIDGPNVPADLTDRLYSPAASTIAIDAAGRHPTYAWWRMEDLSGVFKYLDPKPSISLKRLAEMTEAKAVSWEGKNTFKNINRPEDLESM